MDFSIQLLTTHLPIVAITLVITLCTCLPGVFFLFIRARSLHSQLVVSNRELNIAKENNASLKEEQVRLQLRIAKLVTLIKNERRHTGDKVAILENAKEKLSLQFQTLARQIFEDRSELLGQQNREKLTDILTPLHEQLVHFQKKIDSMQIEEAKERMSLKKEIHHLRDLNQQINKEAINLTQALRGDKKRQGNWGEMVLERVLELSGLRKGLEYSVQGGFRDRENRLLKPDVVVHLPDGKDIIIDAKVSLTAWEKLVASDSDEDQTLFEKEHLQALRNHINGLSEKDYPAIPELNTLDFVLLFIPIESSFHAACEADKTFFELAFDKRVVVVTPTTLLTTLKIIETLWRQERQNQNAQEIAARAGALYDKLRGFLEDFEKVGKQLSSCTVTYDSAMNKLRHGRANIISQAAGFTELGVKVKKKIPKSITSRVEDMPKH